MSQTISRMYELPEQAVNAKAALEREGYSDVHLASASNTDGPVEDLVAEITKGNVLKAHARIYAGGLARGGSLVTVHAAFGGAAKAIRILDMFSPIDSGIAEPEDRPMLWDEATPMSCALQMPVLLDDAAPFSRFWRLRTLSSPSFSLSALLGIKLLSGVGSRHSSFGLPLLMDKAAPLSSLLGLPTLIKQQPSHR